MLFRQFSAMMRGTISRVVINNFIDSSDSTFFPPNSRTACCVTKYQKRHCNCNGEGVGQAFYYFFWTLHFLPSFFHFRAIVFIGGNDKLGSGIPWFLRYSLIQVPSWEDITTNFVDEITMRSIWKWGDRNAIWTPDPPSVSLHQEKVIFRVIGLRAMQFLP